MLKVGAAELVVIGIVLLVVAIPAALVLWLLLRKKPP